MTDAHILPRPMGRPGRKPQYTRPPAALGSHRDSGHLPVPRHAAALKSGCATALGLTLLAIANPAHAQVNANATVIGGAGAGEVTNVGTTTNIELRNEQVVIDWAATISGTDDHVFLPAGSTANFFNDPQFSLTGFTVLNRINPTDALSGGASGTNNVMLFNGTVQSTYNGVTGGNVWFYTPGGILAGATALFDVGSLVLTTSTIDTTGGLFGPSGEIRFTGTAIPTSSVQIAPGARINAPNNGSYVAVVAPVIVQGGTVTVNGSTAYVGAEAANITINAGLFDIAVSTGTEDAHGVTHTGTTTGPASSPGLGTPDPQRLYMMAVAKNQALTMLLSGNMGYTAAASAALEDSAVVLSAGHDISGGSIAAPSATGTDGTSAISIGNGTFLSAVTGQATSDISMSPTGGTLTFNAAGTFTARDNITLGADAGETIRALADISLTAGSGAQGGDISVFANGLAGSSPPAIGLIDVAGQLLLDVQANGNAGLGSTPDVGVDATAGNISVAANGGNILADQLLALATANAGDGITRSGDATAGTIAISALNSGTVTFAATQMDASANVFFAASGSPENGGNANAGSISISADSGALNLGIIQAVAQATGGTATTGAGGSATGGNLLVDITGGTHNWESFFGDVSTALGDASEGGTFGSATPGTSGIGIDVSGSGVVSVSQSMSLYADARSFGGGSSGGIVQAGTIDVSARDGGSLTITNDLFAAASGTAFDGNVLSGQPPVTPDARGGNITVSASGGTFQASGLILEAFGFANSAGITAGNAFGGNITVFADQSSGQRGNFTLTDCFNFGCFLTADGVGASDLAGSNADGGTITVFSSDADMSVTGPFFASANGQAGFSSSDAPGGLSTGGLISIESRAGTLGDGTMTFGDLFLQANGIAALFSEGLFFQNADGGAGVGGTAQIQIDGGTFAASTAVVAADGFGSAVDGNSSGSTPFIGGDGQGGTATFTLSGGTANIGFIDIHADGLGGDARQGDFSTAIAGLTGNGTGGTASFIADAGTLTAQSVGVAALGYGGNGDFFGDNGRVDGGTGTGGIASLTLGAASLADITADSVEVIASGFGGAGSRIAFSSAPGGNGGTGIGGTALLDLSGGSFTAPLVQVFAEGGGGFGGSQDSEGDGGDGGDGIGGNALFIGASLGIAIDDLALSADGLGGRGGESLEIVDFDALGNPIYAYAGGAGGNGGSGTGGIAALRLDLDPDFVTLLITAKGIGSAGAASGTGGLGGLGQGGEALLDVTFGALNVSDSLTIIADGEGGLGGDGLFGQGGRGGNAIGGSAILQASGADSILSTGDLMSITANAFGGAGGGSGLFDGESLNGAAGGNALGGLASLRLSDGASMSLGALSTIAADASGGNGAQGTAGPSGGNGGDGGNATAGSASITLNAGQLTANAVNRININANAQAGIGAQGSINTLAGAPVGQDGLTGSSQGGTAQFASNSGSFALGGVEIQANAQDSGAGTEIGGTAAFFNRDGVVPDPDAVHTIAQLALSASGNGGAGRAEIVNATSGNGLQVDGTLTINANGAPNVPNSGIFISSGATQMGVTGETAFSSGNSINIDVSGNNGLNLADLFSATAAGQIRIRHTGQNIASPFDTIRASFMELQAAGIDAGPGTLLRANNSVFISASGTGPVNSVIADRIIAGSYIDIQSLGTVTTGNLTAGTDIVVTTQSDDNITLGDLTAGDDVWLVAQGALPGTTITTGAVTVTGLGDDGAGSSRAAFSAFPGNAGPAGNLVLMQSAGGVSTGNIANAAGRTILVAERGNIAAGSLSAPQGIVLLARDNVSLGGATTNGRFIVGSPAIFASLPDAYDPNALDIGALAATLGTLTATGPISAGTVTTLTTGNVSLGNVTTTGVTSIRAGGGSSTTAAVATGDISAGSFVEIFAPGSINTGNLTASTDVVIESQLDGTINLGDVTAGDDFIVIADRFVSGVPAGRPVTIGTIRITGLGDDGASTSSLLNGIGSSNPVPPGMGGTRFSNRILVRSSGSLTTGNVFQAGAGTISMMALRGDLLTGSLNDSLSVALYASGNVTFAGGSSSNLFFVGNPDVFEPFDIATFKIWDADWLFGQSESPIGGSLTTTGLLRTGAMVAAAVGDINVDRILATGNLKLISGGRITANELSGRTILPGGLDFIAPQGISIGRLEGDGTTRLTATDGDIFIGELSGPNLVANGRSIDVSSLGNLTVNSAIATAGDVRLSTPGTLRFETLTATRDVVISSLFTRSFSTLSENSSYNSIISAGRNLAITSLNGIDTILLSAGNAMDLNAANGRIHTNVTGTGIINATSTELLLGTSTNSRFGDLTATTGNLLLEANGAEISIGSVRAAGQLSVRTGFLTSLGTANAGESASIFVASGGINGASLTSGTGFSLSAPNGNINVASLTAGGLVFADGQSVDITGPGALSFAQLNATQGNADVRTVGDLAVANGTSTMALNLTSTSGGITAGTLNASVVSLRGSGNVNLDAGGRAGSSLLLTSTSGNVTTGALTGSSVLIDAAGDATIGTIADGFVVSVSAAGTARFLGQVSASSISVSSADIDISSTGRLSGTGLNSQIGLANSNGQRPTFIGGADTASGYSLSADEIGRLSATRIAFFAPRVSAVSSASLGSSRQPDVFVRGFTLNAGSGSGSGTGSGSGASPELRIVTPGKLRVDGDVRITGIGSSGYRFEIDASEAIEVIAGSGSIDMRDGNSGLAGTLAFATDDFIAATQQAIADVAAATTLDARSDRLDSNDGVQIDEGMLRAGAITIEVINGVYIQNTGANETIAARRGFTASSLNIGTESADTQIVINGRLTSDLPGSFATGLQTLPLVSINGVAGSQTGQFDLRSTINGCLISNPASCSTADVNPSDRDTIDEILSPDRTDGMLMPLALIEIAGFEEQGYPPLIDEPVTGAGNDDLWLDMCQPEQECPEAAAN